MSRLPLRQGSDQRLNPDRSYRCVGWRRALFERFGVSEQAALSTLDKRYDQVMIRSIHPAEEERENDARSRAQ
ncbi:MAG TPA: hypothetical protein VGF67_21395 [Ktedonobacteraceae bacterium]